MERLPDRLDIGQIDSLTRAVAATTTAASNGRAFVCFDTVNLQFLSDTAGVDANKANTLIRVPLDELSRMFDDAVSSTSSKKLAKSKIDVDTFKENIKCLGDRTISDLQQICTKLDQHPKKKLSTSPDGEFYLVNRASLLIKSAVGTSESSIRAVDTLLTSAKEVADTPNMDYASVSQLLKHIDSNSWLSKVIAHQPHLSEKFITIQKTLMIRSLENGTVEQKNIVQDLNKLEKEIRDYIVPAVSFLNDLQDQIASNVTMDPKKFREGLRDHASDFIQLKGIEDRRSDLFKKIQTGLENKTITRGQAALIVNKLLSYPTSGYVADKANQTRALYTKSDLTEKIAQPGISAEKKESLKEALEEIDEWFNSDQKLLVDDAERKQELKKIVPGISIG